MWRWKRPIKAYFQASLLEKVDSPSLVCLPLLGDTASPLLQRCCLLSVGAAHEHLWLLFQALITFYAISGKIITSCFLFPFVSHPHAASFCLHAHGVSGYAQWVQVGAQDTERSLPWWKCFPLAECDCLMSPRECQLTHLHVQTCECVSVGACLFAVLLE